VLGGLSTYIDGAINKKREDKSIQLVWRKFAIVAISGIVVCMK